MGEHRKGFNDYYAFGRIAEGQIAQWLIRAQHYSILPAYEIEIPSGKGPRLLTQSNELISPDMLASRIQEKVLLIRWIEAKHKTRFTWYRKSGKWQTGIDLRHYEDYIEVQKQTKIPVYILFLHQSSIPSQGDLANRSPSACPTGLFCQSLSYLFRNEDHRDTYDRLGRDYPMVYWNHCELTQLATLEEVQAIGRPSRMEVPA